MNLLFLFSMAHAGFWSTFCERHLVSNDPYEYEMYATAWVQRQADHLRVKQAWGKSSEADQNMLRLLEKELRRRQDLARLVGE